MAIADPIALNLADRIALRSALIPRCQAIVANYALYHIGGGNSGEPNYAQRLAWAKNAIQNVAFEAERISWHVLNNTSFLNGGSSIEDAELTGVVEAAIVANYVDPVP